MVERDDAFNDNGLYGYVKRRQYGYAFQIFVMPSKKTFCVDLLCLVHRKDWFP